MQRMTKRAPEAFPALSVEIIQFSQLCAAELGKVRLQPPVFPLHPQLFQVKRQRKEKQLNAHVRLASSQESAETKVRFQQSKGTLYLDGTAQAQIDAALRGNVLPRGLPQRLQRFVYTQFLRLLNIVIAAA